MQRERGIGFDGAEGHHDKWYETGDHQVVVICDGMFHCVTGVPVERPKWKSSPNGEQPKTTMTNNYYWRYFLLKDIIF